MGHEHRSPAERIEALLDDREQYIDQQEQIRQERMEIELKLLLLMINERTAEDPRLVREIRKAHVSEEGLPSFDTLYDEWKRLGFELDRQHSFQQRAEIDIATCVLDTDQTVLADLDEAFGTVRWMRGETQNTEQVQMMIRSKKNPTRDR